MKIVKRIIQRLGGHLFSNFKSYLASELAAHKELILSLKDQISLLSKKSHMFTITTTLTNKKIYGTYLINSDDQRVFLDPSDHWIFTHMIDNRSWEPHLDELYPKAKLLNPSCLMIDVGANIGLHALKAHKYDFNEIFCFEPDPKTFDFLKLNLKLNGYYKDTFMNCACSSVACAMMFTRTLSSGQSGLLTTLNVQEAGMESFSVPVVKLDDVIPKEKWSNIGILKIDVEGNEPNVIEGAIGIIREASKLIMIIESHTNPKLSYLVEKLCIDFGFSAYDYSCGKTPKHINGLVQEYLNIQACDVVLIKQVV
jgi:FkbM family methyltransferase